MPKRKVAIFIVATLLVSIFNPVASQAAAKNCKDVGSYKLQTPSIFKCVKKGKFTSWVSLGEFPSNFEQLAAKSNLTPIKVWLDGQNLLTKAELRTNFEIKIGPNTKFPNNRVDHKITLSNASGYWKNFNQPVKTEVFFFNQVDLPWVSQELINLNGSWFKPSDLEANCANLNNCGAFGGTYNGVGQLFEGVNSVSNGSDPQLIGHSEFHEFTHVVQTAQFTQNKTINGYGLIPCWISEGQPQVAGYTATSKNLKEYISFRKIWLQKKPGPFGDYSQSGILNFLENAGEPRAGKCTDSYRSYVYGLGFLLVESLAANGGIEKTMTLISDLAKTGNFESSFQKVYGTDWSIAKKDLAASVAKQYATN